MKFLTAILLSLALAGCAGKVIKEPIFNPDGTIARNAYGMSSFKKTKYSRTAVIEEARARSIEAVARINQQNKSACSQILSVEMSTAAGEAEQMRSFMECQRAVETTNLVAKALGRPTSDIEAIAQESTRSVKHVQDGLTERVVSGIRYGRDSLIAAAVYGVMSNQSKDRRKENIAAIENAGDTTVGDISIDASQNGTGGDNYSNDVAGGGEGSNATGISSGGDGAVNGDGAQVTLNIGKGSAVTASDNARTFQNTVATQQLDSSATGAVNHNSNIDQQPVIDDATDVIFENEPNNGVNQGTRNNQQDEDE